jgi:hypothetical protein
MEVMLYKAVPQQRPRADRIVIVVLLCVGINLLFAGCARPSSATRDKVMKFCRDHPLAE